MLADTHNYKQNKGKIAKLWVHETKRVFQDRLVFDEDISKFEEYQKKAFNSLIENYIKLEEEEKKEIFSDTNVFSSF